MTTTPPDPLRLFVFANVPVDMLPHGTILTADYMVECYRRRAAQVIGCPWQAFPFHIAQGLMLADVRNWLESVGGDVNLWLCSDGGFGKALLAHLTSFAAKVTLGASPWKHTPEVDLAPGTCIWSPPPGAVK